MQSNQKQEEINNQKPNRIMGMKSAQVAFLLLLAFIGLTSIGILVRLMLYNKPIEFAHNIFPSETVVPKNQISGCNSVDVHSWVDQTVPRLNAIDSDIQFLNSLPPQSYSEYVPYAERARQRYQAQLSQRTPACLANVHELTLEELRLFWQGLEAASSGNEKGVRDNFSRLVEISLQVDRSLQEVALPLGSSSTPTFSLPGIDPTPASKIIFRDDFQDSSFTAANWSSLGGLWIIQDGVLGCAANGKYLANIVLPEDFTFQLDIMGENVIDKIIVFRAIDDNSHYGIDFRTAPYNDIVLVKSLPGNTGQILQTIPFENPNNAWYKIEVDVEDNHIRVFVNSQPTIDFIDPSNPIMGGTIGVGAMLQPASSFVYYDNVVVSHK